MRILPFGVETLINVFPHIRFSLNDSIFYTFPPKEKFWKFV